MKKTLSIVLILVLMLSLFGCKSKPIADDEEVYVEKEQTEQAADAGESEQQQTEQEQNEQEQSEQNINEAPQENNVTQEQQTEQTEQTELDKAPPCEVTIDDDFEDDKILVLLTREESRKQKQYTAEDFPELDIENISVLIKYKPKKDNRLGLSITLKDNDKQKVIDGIRTLEEYEMVYSAEPNSYGIILNNQVSDNTTVEQIENIISEMSITPRYSPTDSISEYNADLSTLACCAKKYTAAGNNNTITIGFVGLGIYSSVECGEKVTKFFDCTVDPVVEQYTTPKSAHTSVCANVVARNQVDTMSIPHSSECGNNICSGTCNNIEIYSLSILKHSSTECNIGSYIRAVEYADDLGIKVLCCSDPIKMNSRQPMFENAVSEYDGVFISTACNTSNTNPITEKAESSFDNQNIDLATNYVYPTSCPSDNVIVVGNSECTSTNILASSTSCYGQTKVDLFAPGYTYDTINDKGVSGTSYATPRVAGAAAVLLNINDLLTPAQIKHYLIAGVNKSSNLTNKCVSGGSLNIYTSAKMLIGDMACDWESAFSGHFTDKNNLQVAAYTKTAYNQIKSYVWTYNSSTGKFSDPIHWYTNDYYALNSDIGNNMYRIVAGDFDGDGYDEICSLYDYMDYLFIQGTGYSCRAGYTNLPVENFTGRVVALDVDGDGKDEVAALYRHPTEWGRTLMYIWKFTGSKSNMFSTQTMCYDSGANNYESSYITDRMVAGDFDADGCEEIAAIYVYPTTNNYSLHMFNIVQGSNNTYSVTRTSLIYNRSNEDATKVTGRVVACDYNGDSRDEIVALYDNSSIVADGIINYGFAFSSGSSWTVNNLYTSDPYIYRAELSTHLVTSGDYNKDGYDDVSTFYKLPAANSTDVRGKICVSNGPNLYGYFTKWDPLS